MTKHPFMRKHLPLFFIIVLVQVSVIRLYAQNCMIRGRVTDENTSDLMPFVNIGIQGSSAGTYSDSSGHYKLEVPRGEHTLVVTCIGYERQERHVVVHEQKEMAVDFILSPVTQELNTVVVSGSKYEQKVQESIASIEVLKSHSIHASNPQSIDKAIDKIPGITIIDSEPQIRAGSGFSSGLGSRVMVMVDEIPILRGDAGRPSWGFLPVDDVEQIEVVKGAASVVYGSSAITGAINIRTAYPKDKPITRLNTFLGIYNTPSRSYATPWSGLNPLIYGISLSHLQKFDNFDLGVGANYFTDQGYIGGTPEVLPDSVFNKGESERRVKLYFNTRIRNKKIDGLTYGLNGNFMYSDNAQTFFWYNADTGIYRSYPGALSHFKEFTFYVDPFIKYFNDKGNSHSFKNRIYYGNTIANNDQSNSYLTIYSEYQYTKTFKKFGGMVLIAGLMNSYSHSYGQVFSGILAADGTTTAGEFGTFESENLAIYMQFEKKFLDRVTILVGGRWEYYQIAGFFENKPIFRAGFNLQAARGTFIRGSIGQGYRAPSIGERYITTNSGGFGFYPNPDLASETSLSYEIGIKQFYKIGKFAGMLDLAGFLENYDNYVEFNFGNWGNTTVDKSLGFKFLNTGPARIYGVDFTLAGEGKLSRIFDLSLLLGYTYSVPKALDPNLVYYEHQESGTSKIRQYTYINTSSDTSGFILKYRIQHLGKADIQLTLKKRISAGITGKYYGFMKNIDIFLIQLDQIMHSGIGKYREEHHKGNFIVDFRISYLLRDFKFSLIINNLFNTEYSLRPITIEPQRTTSLQVVLTI
ncbi:MAG: TonB-dependent receptor [Bacteroidetes bacterium]|nr:MAG: TonB-dependent receptor [Bacteroidota bacterium]